MDIVILGLNFWFDFDLFKAKTVWVLKDFWGFCFSESF
jgi:hypothetical protein